jgi:fluoroquinolone transport system permease protein
MNRNLYLIKGDWKIIGRDPMLFLCMVAPLILLFFALVLFPILSGVTLKYFNFPLEVYFPIGRLFVFPLGSMLFGMAYGFILLDERDGGLISYLAITPVGKSGYLQIRMLMPVLLSVILNVLYLTVTGFTHFLNPAEIIAISVITSMEAPLVLLLLGAYASNKVEGMALSKGIGLILLPMLVDYLLTGSWRWFMAVSPLWWIERAVFSTSPERWLYIAGSAVVHTLFILLFFNKFNKRFG